MRRYLNGSPTQPLRDHAAKMKNDYDVVVWFLAVDGGVIHTTALA